MCTSKLLEKLILQANGTNIQFNKYVWIAPQGHYHELIQSFDCQEIQWDKNEKLQGSFVDVYKIAWLDFQVLKFLQLTTQGSQMSRRRNKFLLAASSLSNSSRMLSLIHCVISFYSFLFIPDGRLKTEWELNSNWMYKQRIILFHSPCPHDIKLTEITAVQLVVAF